MLAAISNLRGKLSLTLLFALTFIFVSCASERQQVRLVNDPDDHGDSTMPWNKQEKWETGGQFAGMTDRR
jgi:hypothetical protein